MDVQANIRSGAYDTDVPFISDPSSPAQRKVMQIYAGDQHRLTEQFRADLLEQFGVSDNPKAGDAYYLAWERGHAEGLESVYGEFQTLVDLIK